VRLNTGQESRGSKLASLARLALSFTHRMIFPIGRRVP
jgi:hypothetical protein